MTAREFAEWLALATIDAEEREKGKLAAEATRKLARRPPRHRR